MNSSYYGEAEKDNTRSFYIICYPRGDMSKLAVAEISWACDYEKNDYRLASRNDYDTYKEASKAAKSLASENGLEYIADSEEPEDFYLD